MSDPFVTFEPDFGFVYVFRDVCHGKVILCSGEAEGAHILALKLNAAVAKLVDDARAEAQRLRGLMTQAIDVADFVADRALEPIAPHVLVEQMDKIRALYAEAAKEQGE